MNESRIPNVGVVDLRPGRQRFCLFNPDDDVIASQSLDGFDGDLNDRDHAVWLVSKLQQKDHRMDTMILVTPASHGVVAVDHDQYRPDFLGGYPIPIYRISHIVAAAHSVPDDWQNFQLIDEDSRIWWLLKRRNGKLVDASSASFFRLNGKLADQISQWGSFGFEHVVQLGESANASSKQTLPEESKLSANALLRGAKRAFEKHVHSDGSHLFRDHHGRKVISLATHKLISYKITHVDRPVFSMHEPALAEIANNQKVLLVVDRNVDRLYGKAIDAYSREFLNSAGKLVFDASELRKNADTVNYIHDAAVRLDIPRNGILVAIGGGVTLDVVGFAASTYRRGIGYLRIPTTLVGLIDAGIGVKQGINCHGKKNLIGSFYPALAVINDSSFLRTLPVAEVSCGMAEIVKIAMVKDRALFELVEEHGEALRDSRFSQPHQQASHVLVHSAMAMAEELQSNLYESDLRRLVDFGHTFSPVIEIQSEYRISHGYAVAMDICLSTAIAVARGVCASEVLDRVIALFQRLCLPAGPSPCSTAELVEALVSARLHRGGNLNLVVPSAIGQATFLQDVSSDDIEEASLVLGDKVRCRVTSNCA